MREIKFRAFRKNHKDYETGWVVPNQVFEFSDANGFTEFGFDIPEDVVVMQFTNLLDKNGKECYESDLVKLLDYDKPLTVFWCDDCAGWRAKLEGYGNNESIAAHDFEIVGNIYESDLSTSK